MPRRKVGSENFSKRNGVIRKEYSDDYDYSEDGSDDDSEYRDARRRYTQRRRESERRRVTKKKEKEEEKESEFEKLINKCKDKCTGAILRGFNFLAYALLGLVTLIRFAYLADSFSFFYLLQVFNILAGIILMALSEDIGGPKLGKKIKTYFNILDSAYRKGFIIIFIAIILMERNDKGEELFAIIAIIIGACDLCLGYRDSGLKKLPMNPWGGDDDDSDEEKGKKRPKLGSDDDSLTSSDDDTDKGSDVDLEANAESKKAKKLNKRKKKE